MNTSVPQSIISCLTAMTCFCMAVRAPAADNELTAAEKAAGWKLLFDGKSLAGWRNFKKPDPPAKGWVVEDGVLKHVAKAGGGDIITDAQFENFDLRWDWRMAPGANSGLKYFISETRSGPIGHEYQLIDDTRHTDAKQGSGKRVTAAFYDVLRPGPREVKPVGEWNTSGVRVKGKTVEHWLNGKMVLTYQLDSPELKTAIAESKFKNTERFGTPLKGHILLQDHGDEAAFRNIKIRVLE